VTSASFRGRRMPQRTAKRRAPALAAWP
jgi:hypothetical protein